MRHDFKRPILALVGCSHTAEFTPRESVGRSLSHRLPGHTVLNMAFKGSSRMYAAHVCDRILREIGPEIMIFQLAGPNRFTRWIDHDPFQFIKSEHGRYHWVDHLRISGINNLNSGVVYNGVSQRSEEDLKIGRMLFDWFTDDMLQLEADVIADAFRPRVQLMYSHRRDFHARGQVISLFDVFGEHCYRSHLIDEGHHFDIAGIERTADWIIYNLLRDGHLTPDQVIKPT